MDNKLNINGIWGLDGSYVAKLMPWDWWFYFGYKNNVLVCKIYTYGFPECRSYHVSNLLLNRGKKKLSYKFAIAWYFWKTELDKKKKKEKP